MFDWILGLRQDVKGGAQDEAEITISRPLFFWILDYITGMGLSAHGFTHA
jgi:hypothetical protein